MTQYFELKLIIEVLRIAIPLTVGLICLCILGYSYFKERK